MGVSSKAFREYLAPDESVERAAQGTILDGSYRSEGAIGITDRRVLFLTDSDRFLDVTHDAICSIGSRPRSTLTASGIAYPLAAAVGVLIAVSGFVGVLGLRADALTFALALAIVGGAVAAEYVRRSGVGVERPALGDAWRALVTDRRAFVEELSGFGLRRPAAGRRGGDESLVLIIGVASLFPLVGLVAVTERLLVVPLVVVSLAGVALADSAYRRTRILETSGGGRRHERAVSIHLVDGRTVNLRVDPTERLDRELSGAVRESLGERAVTELQG